MENLKRKKYIGIAGIYLLKSSKGKLYVGSSCDLYKRINGHIRALTRNIHTNQYLQRHYNKHGADVFTVEVIETIDKVNNYKKKLIKREQVYLNKYYNKKNCFNIHKEAIYFKNNPEKYKKHSKFMKSFWKENRDKMSAVVIKNLEKIDRTKINHKNGFTSGNLTEFTKEWKENMSIAAKKRGRQPNTFLTVHQYNKEGKFIKTWDSARDVMRFYKKVEYNSTNISACCKGKRKYCLGYLWSYKLKENYYE